MSQPFWKETPYSWKTGWAVAAFVAGIAALIVIFGAAGYGWESHECSVAGGQIQRATHYSFFGGGCYVDIGGGQKVPLDNYNAFKGAK